jgi:hypothetical protein
MGEDVTRPRFRTTSSRDSLRNAPLYLSGIGR